MPHKKRHLWRLNIIRLKKIEKKIIFIYLPDRLWIRSKPDQADCLLWSSFHWVNLEDFTRCGTKPGCNSKPASFLWREESVHDGLIFIGYGIDRNCIKIVYGDSVLNKMRKSKLPARLLGRPWPDQPDRLIRPCSPLYVVSMPGEVKYPTRARGRA